MRFTAIQMLLTGAVAVVIAFVVTQVVSPALRGLPLFPAFRRSVQEADERLREARLSADTARTEREAAALAAETERLRPTKPEG